MTALKNLKFALRQPKDIEQDNKILPGRLDGERVLAGSAGPDEVAALLPAPQHALHLHLAQHPVVPPSQKEDY